MRRLLVLNFFPAFVPPRSGGEQRYHHFYDALSRFYDVTLLSPTYPDRAAELVAFHGTFREHRVPKEPLHVRLHHRLAADGIRSECSALVCALASAEDDRFRAQYRALVGDVDAVVHDSPFMVNYDEQLGRDGKPRVYNSYNVEADLAASMFPGPSGRRYVDFIADIERALVQRSDLIFATSDTERRAFRERYGCPDDKLSVAPNGFTPRPMPGPGAVDAAAHRRRLGLDLARPLAVFIGSAHPPNIEAARFICDHLASALPAVQLAIAGAVCGALTSARANVRLLGVLSDDDTARLYRACDLALNPVVSGAGTNVKLLDYMGAGLAIVTTPFGARGIPFEDDRHGALAERDAFAGAIERLLADPSRRARVGRAAADLARTQFTWEAIAGRARARIDELFRPRGRGGARRRPRVLVLNDFPVSRPLHGGAVRIHELFTRLSDRHDVTLLCLTDDDALTEVRVRDRFTEVRVPKTDAHRAAERKSSADHHVSINDILASLACGDNPELVAQYRRRLRESDLVVLEHPYLAPLLDIERPAALVVYEALNVETALKAHTLREHPDRAALLRQVQAVEDLACERAHRVVCVSNEDIAQFRHRVDPSKLALVPNGVDTKPYLGEADDLSRLRSSLAGKPLAVFVGSAHSPNVDAVRYIAEDLAPRLPHVAFAVVGSACDAFRRRRLSPNVLLCGIVSDREKRVLLRLSDVALNPMSSGGGSSLKIAEYLAAGLPVLSTDVGLRGFELRAGDDAVVAPLDAFPAAVESLLGDAERRAQLGERGRQLARAHLDWDVLAAEYAAILEAARRGRTKRLLVTTFRFTDPALGGAETYLLELLKELHARGRFAIDVATFDVGRIANHLHFSARYEPGAHATPPYVERVHGFSPQAPARADVLQAAERLYMIWQEENLAQARRFVDRFQDVELLGGWYAAERSGDQISRWTSERAEIHCPASVDALVVAGAVPGKADVTVLFDGDVVAEHSVRGDFSLSIPLGEHPAGIVQLRAPAARRGPDDPRRLGLRVTGITAVSRTGSAPVSLDRDFATVLRSTDVDAWVTSLIDVTRQRAAVDDALFAAVRGPASAAFEDWLKANIARYDVVLAHGVPFAPAVVTATQASRAGVPYAMLPHYHFDDKYYHWNSYYEAFASADVVLAFPERSKQEFFDKIGARALCVPGGGVHAAEFEHLESCVREFRRVHGAPSPFVLVLGRKSQGKRYEVVVDAVDAVRASGQPCDVVLIGPDEDAVPLASPAATHYGSQPRAVVLGALASCAALATMSESESFGIVVIEAWMCRKPVIVSRECPAFTELVEHGVDGFVCGTGADVARAISTLLADPGLARSLGERGHDKASARFTWAQVAAPIGDALSSIAR